MSRSGYVPKRLCPEMVMSRSGYVPKRLCPEVPDILLEKDNSKNNPGLCIILKFECSQYPKKKKKTPSAVRLRFLSVSVNDSDPRA